jgi:hypothetical protein
MSTIDDTHIWLRGELVEHASVGVLGVSLMAIAALFWRFGALPAARSMVTPLLCVGALFLVIGALGIYTNSQRGAAYEQMYALDPVAFVTAERARVEGFLTWYRWTLAAASVFMVAGLVLFNVSNLPTIRAISMGLMMLGFGGMMIDNVSESNAKAYFAALTKA